VDYIRIAEYTHDYYSKSYLLISVAESSLSPAERRAGTNEFIEITQAEFDTVSTLIKGRVKLVEVNMV
jgi:hypothetical protein